MPDEMIRGLCWKLQTLGKDFSAEGQLDPKVLAEIARPERFPWFLGPVFRVFLKAKIARRYFYNLLVENDAYERRNDRPLIERD